MESLKKYLPWIIGGVIALIVLMRLRGQSTRLVPQTQIVETPQVDQLAESRAGAFAGLLQVIGLQIGEEASTERARIAGAVAGRAQRFQFDLGLKALETDLSKTSILADAARRAAEIDFQSREQDRQVQQRAIDRYYSSRTTSDIVGSVSQALGSIFGGRRQGTIFTPPINPNPLGRLGGLF